MLEKNLLEDIKKIAHRAGEAVLKIYQQTESKAIATKADDTPLTEADLIAHKIIVEGLQALMPRYPILSEESADISFTERKQWKKYWLVDPIDGTKEFLERTDEFSILIALIENHEPIMGVVYAPVLQQWYYAAKNQGAFQQTVGSKPQMLRTGTLNFNNLRIIASRRHGLTRFTPLLTDFEQHAVINRGSALKFTAVASSEADIYPRFGLTSEWDTAAGQCIVEEAGGKVMTLDGEVLQYNTKESLINPEFIVVGDPTYDWLSNIKKL